jgi:hypothetical protein
MEDKKQQTSRDPDADVCFLDRSTDERRDHEWPIREATLHVRPPDGSAGSQPTLPSGEVIDSKNTLQSFVTRASGDVVTSAPGVIHRKNPPPPTLPSGAVIDSKNTLQSFHNVPPNTIPPSSSDATSNTVPTLPSGEVIDSKNTLQSFGTRASGVVPSAPRATHHPMAPPPTLPSGAVIDSKNTLQSIHNVTPNTVPPSCSNATSNTVPTLPSGEVIDSKNTLQSFRTGSANHPHRPPPPTNFSSNNNTPVDLSTAEATFPHLAHTPGASNRDENADAPAENVYEAELVTDPPRRKSVLILCALGIVAMVIAVVIVGVCFSGNCGSNNRTKAAAPVTRRPTFPPTASPTATPVDVLVERAVSTFVNNITYLGREIEVTGTIAESRALAWVIQEDPLFAENKSALLDLNSMHDDEVSFRVRQRYALATLWFQQEKEGVFINTWKTITGWKSETECHWFGIICVNGTIVTEIMFYNYDTGVANGFIGSISPDIGLLPSLEWFSMRSNKVTGSIPESLGQCRQMKLFDVSDGAVNGTIPSSLGQWSEITHLDLSKNNIIGTIPESSGRWTGLVSFSVADNKLSGSISSLLGQWISLELLDFSLNMFTNTIPDGLGKLVNATLFVSSYNRLTGTLPSSIGKLTALTAFYVQENSLTGTIPSSIGNWSEIKLASFEMNDFTGTMPLDICTNIQGGDSLSCDCQVNCSCCTISCSV